MPSGATRSAAVIGHPVAHSLSPLIHNLAFRELGLDWTYLAHDVAPGSAADALGAMRTLGIEGLSVTMPHKEDVARHVDRREPVAERLGAVNCVWVDPATSALVGANTDGEGFLDGLRGDHGAEPAGRRLLVLGTGGAARAVIDACQAAGAASISVAGRRPDARNAAVEIAAGVGVGVEFEDSAALASAVAEADIVVNATPVGMGDDPHSPLEGLSVGPQHVVVDLIYHPLTTPLLAAASASGASVSNGLSMLIGQAAAQFRRWTGVEMPVDVVRGGVAAAVAGAESP